MIPRSLEKAASTYLGLFGLDAAVGLAERLLRVRRPGAKRLLPGPPACSRVLGRCMSFGARPLSVLRAVRLN